MNKKLKKLRKINVLEILLHSSLTKAHVLWALILNGKQPSLKNQSPKSSTCIYSYFVADQVLINYLLNFKANQRHKAAIVMFFYVCK